VEPFSDTEVISLCREGATRFLERMERDKDVFDEALRAGVDVDLIDTNLALPIAERWRQHDAALRFMLKLQEAKDAHDAGLQPTDR